MVAEYWGSSYHIACETNLQQPIRSLESLKECVDGRIQLITLADGRRYIGKSIKQSSWLGIRSKENLEFTEDIAAIVSKQLHITNIAHRINNRYFVPFKNEWLLFIPYQEGKYLSSWNTSQSFQLGLQLAAIHQLKLPKEGALPFPGIVLEETIYSDVFREQIQQCNQYRLYGKEQYLTSHRDIHHGNVVWQNKADPYLIDWESTGLIHPFVELVGLAVNCAGIAAGEFIRNNFAAALLGYRQKTCLPQTDRVLWQLTYHSWLLWLDFCINQGLETDVEKTVHSLNLLKEHMPSMQETYSACQIQNA